MLGVVVSELLGLSHAEKIQGQKPKSCTLVTQPASHLVLRVSNPRLEFARLVEFALAQARDNRVYRTLENGAVVGQDVTLGEGVVIEPLAFLDHDVTIGDRTIIRSGAKIRRFVEIGRECRIRENAVIGSDGFGFERDSRGLPVRLPHLGGVRIGDNVEVGALTTVVGGTIDPTIIEDYVKIDDHVHVGHNSIIRRGALLTACAEVGARVEVGEFAWLGANCSTFQGIQIGAHAVVGLGATVLRSVAPNTTVAGNPARVTTELRKINAAQARLLDAVKDGRL